MSEGTLLRPVEGLVFDFDGVIADSNGAHTVCRLEAFGRLGFSTDPAIHEQAHRLGNYPRQIIGAVLKLTGEIAQDADVDEDPTVARVEALKTELYYRKAAEGLDPITGAIDFVKRAAARYGKDRLAIATTASIESEVHPFLRHHGLTDAFSVMVGKEDTLAHAASMGATPREFTKPHPFVYEQTIRRLGIDAPRAAAIEDHPNGIKSAQTAGLQVVGITTTHSAEDLHQAEATTSTFDDAADILGIAA